MIKTLHNSDKNVLTIKLVWRKINKQSRSGFDHFYV